MSIPAVWSEYNQPEVIMSQIPGTFLNLRSIKATTPMYTCTTDYCNSMDADEEFIEDDYSVDGDWVCAVEPTQDEEKETLPQFPKTVELSMSPEITGIQLEPSQNVLEVAPISKAKADKKAKNKKVTAQKAKPGQKIKYTQPPVEVPKPENAPPKRVSKTVFYAVPCGAFKLRSGQVHGKALKPSRILLDEVREQERQRKAALKQKNAANRALRAKLPPVPEIPAAELPQVLPEPVFPEPVEELPAPPCDQLSRCPSTQISDGSMQHDELEHLTPMFDEQLAPESFSQLNFRKQSQPWASEPMQEELIPPQDVCFSISEYLNVAPQADPVSDIDAEAFMD